VTRSLKAALLSGLIFPGVGHFIVKRYIRGAILITFTLIAFFLLLEEVTRQALTVIKKITNGDIPLEVGAVAELVSNSASAAESPALNIATLVVGTCWLFGIIDSYRLGREG